MSKQVFSKIKKSAPFKKTDLIVYLLIAVIIAVTFLFFTLDTKTYVSGFYVSVKDQKVIDYDFEKNTYSILNNDLVKVETNGSNVSFTVTLSNGEFNVITVNKTDKSVKISDANCPRKDCVSFSPIVYGKKNKLIYCAVHDLRVVATGDDYYVPPTTGDAL